MQTSLLEYRKLVLPNYLYINYFHNQSTEVPCPKTQIQLPTTLQKLFIYLNVYPSLNTLKISTKGGG
jgi:hypothetical protein